MKKKLTTRSTVARLATITVLSVLMAGPAAMAQSGGNTGSSGAAQSRPAREAPVGHRQPRAGDVPSEKNLGNPNDPLNKEDAVLDRKIKSICRGC